jgi:hypothetical protein
MIVNMSSPFARFALRPDLVGTGAAGAGLIAVIVLGDESQWWQCPFRGLTGILCPGCGMQHAISALLSGDLAGAIAANPTVVVGPLLVGLALFFMRTQNAVGKQVVIFGAIAYTVIFSIFRNF